MPDTTPVLPLFGLPLVAAPLRSHTPMILFGVMVLGVAVAMTLITASLGARLAHVLDALVLRWDFAGFILIVALNMLRKAMMG